MKTWSIELSGTITRDIIFREVDAANEDDVRKICAAGMPSYRVRSIIPMKHVKGCLLSDGSPANAV